MGRKTERKDSSSSDEEVKQNKTNSSQCKEESSKFEPITEIEFKFLLQDAETRTEGLSRFISTSEAFTDGVPCPDVVAKYLKSSPACAELLTLLEPSETCLKSPGIALVFKCLEQILTRIRMDLIKYLASGETIVQKLLAAYMRPVYASLQAQSKSNIIKSAVQLLIAMALLSEKTKKALQTRLNFNHVHFSALFRRRNRKDSQDVRSCMILLTLAFLVNSDSNTVRFMVQQKIFLQMTIAGLKFDARDVVVDVLLTFLDKIVENSSVSKTDKTKLFSEVVLKQIAELHQWQGPLGWSPSGDAKDKPRDCVVTRGASLMQQQTSRFKSPFLTHMKVVAGAYHKFKNCLLLGTHFTDRWTGKSEGKLLSQGSCNMGLPSSAEAEEDKAHVADVSDNFLQELCCSSKHGIGFYDKTVGTSARSQNPLLSHFVSWLGKHIEEPRKAALMVNILAASPDLVGGVITELQASLEPRWSDSWAHRLEWLGSLYSTLPDIPPFLGDKERKISREQNIVTMATVFCLPPAKVTSTLNQSLKHENIQVRHRYLELVQVLAKKAHAIQKALASWAVEMGYLVEDAEQLTENFTATVLKGLPSVGQLFACVDKIMALTAVASAAGKDGVTAIETKLCVGLGEHTSLLLQVLSLYQSLMPSLLAQRPKDISKLIQVVSGQLERSGGDTHSVDADNVRQTEEEEEDETMLLPQLYLLKLLSETDVKTLSLNREGMLEKLLLLAEHNRYMDLTVRLICKMLQSLEIFSDHGEELAIWLRNALEVAKPSWCKDDDQDPGKNATPQASASGKSVKKQNQRESSFLNRTEDRQEGSCNLLLPFLARCITALVNNPTPYTDRVMEALAERPVRSDDDGGDEQMEEPMETSSLGANESAKEGKMIVHGELKTCWFFYVI
ncbi:nucleolar pre-ribosomal-associated protein 1-like [Elysia marginata]|uniref:Nucleolar pre-ribosomal-associated protein 1-like n=1 Tax=Elysia marginata TaxID=1093978 RepID=A0AAV4I259_9GAST|nr:nucleolar pre-ribosomal-associated protein 1-like [Elysia marginata]